MEENQKLNIGIGSEKSASLEAKPVAIVGLDITQKEFAGKQTDQLVVMVKHPDKEEPFQMYSVAYQKGSSIKTVGFTLYYDSKGQLLQNTAPAELLRIYNVKVLNELVGKTIPTVLQLNKSYLALKAY